ncbi:MAG: UbiX family flavin prenyltransferase [Pseudomonadota bacterium]
MRVLQVSMTQKPQAKKIRPRRLVVAITGASGVIYGVRALEMLQKLDIESHVILSKAAEMTIAYELDITPKTVKGLATKPYAYGDVGAAISSGSYQTDGMLILPCSVRTMSEIAFGVTTSLISRAADVCLKERRRLVLGFRETPLHSGHIRAMGQVSDMGGIIAPIVPAFYNRPETIDDIIHHTIGRLLDLFVIDCDDIKRWGE